jgi:signal peptidase II
MEYEGRPPRELSRPANLPSRSTIVLSAFLVCAACDQATKVVAQFFLDDGTVVSIFGDFIRFQMIHNQGGFLSTGATLSFGGQFLFTFWICCVLMVVLFYILLARSASLLTILSAALVFAGGASNLADRLMRGGSVIDFVTLNVPGLSEAVFNLADVFIVTGFLLLVVTSLAARMHIPQHIPEQTNP